jgi:3-methyl-2-oxobutanoate hydroxymethyltransferase
MQTEARGKRHNMADTNSPKRSRVTLKSLSRKKAERTRITAIGVYDAPMAAIADRVGFDLLIVGNAGPMSLLGHADPTSVTFEEQLMLTRAVSRVAKYGLFVGHLPFMSYHALKEQAITSAARMVRDGGAHVVKCEGLCQRQRRHRGGDDTLPRGLPGGYLSAG